MIERPAPGETSFAPGALERRILTVLVGALLGTAICFRLMYLSSMPGISGDEGWWGVQSAAWLSGRPYEARTTSGNPTDLFFLIPVALVHAIARPLFGVSAGLLAALFMAVAFLHARDSHYATTDVPMVFFVMAALPTDLSSALNISASGRRALRATFRDSRSWTKNGPELRPPFFS